MITRTLFLIFNLLVSFSFVFIAAFAIFSKKRLGEFISTSPTRPSSFPVYDPSWRPDNFQRRFGSWLFLNYPQITGKLWN